MLTLNGGESGRTVALGELLDLSPNDHVLWLDVRRTQGSRRQGTSKTKERGEVRGSTRKLYRQKGTGLARSGSISSPLRRSGGRTFGPRPRKYRIRLSKKVRRLARLSALAYKAQNERLHVVESLAFESPSTREMLDLVSRLDLTGWSLLVVTARHAPQVYRSSSNLDHVRVKEARNLTAEDILRAGTLLVEEAAMDTLCPPSAKSSSE